MEDKLISRYDILVNRYKELVSEKLSRKDFIKYNEILFSAHSCAIEGNSFSVDETRTLKEKGLGMIPKGKTLLEAFEILDHFQAYEYLLKNLDRPLTEELLKTPMWTTASRCPMPARPVSHGPVWRPCA